MAADMECPDAERGDEGMEPRSCWSNSRIEKRQNKLAILCPWLNFYENV
jgi:hypothetical protein